MGDINQERPDLVKKGWTQQMWDARQAQAWHTKALTTDDQFKHTWDTGEGDRIDGAPQGGAINAAKPDPQAALDAQIQEFYKHMSAPLDPNDPEVKAADQIASNVAEHSAKLRGIQGGVVASEVGRNVANANVGIQNQRNQLAAQTLGLQNQRSLGLANLANQQDQYTQNRMDAQAQQQNQMLQQALGTLGAAAGAYAGAGTSLGAAGGAQAGGGLASGLGGLAGPNYRQAAKSSRGSGGYSGQGY